MKRKLHTIDKLPFESEYTVEQLQSITRKQWFVILTPEKRELLIRWYFGLHFNTHCDPTGNIFGKGGFSRDDIQQATVFYDALIEGSCAEHIIAPSIILLCKYRKHLFFMFDIIYPDCLFEEPITSVIV